MSDLLSLCSVFKNGTPKVVVVGGGYVGLPLAISAQLSGCDVTVLDVDGSKVKEINSGVRPPDFPSCTINATLDPSCQLDADAILICVPTPLKEEKIPDLTCLSSAVDSFLKYQSEKGCLLSIESTVYPGYTMELESRISKCTYLSFSPERINPGTPFHELLGIPKVVGANSDKSLSVAIDFYSRLFKNVVPVSSSTVAELSKLLENSFRAVNIALVNEFAMVCRGLDVDVKNVIDAASTKSFGFVPFQPGPGVGGHCIPIDSYYLLSTAEQHNMKMPLIRQAMMINNSMPSYIVSRIKEFSSCQEILVVGVSYKEEVSDIRESPALDIIAELRSNGYNVSYHDPLIPELEQFGMKSVDLDREFDLGVITVGHSCLDTSRILESCSIVFDTRNILPNSFLVERL